jgi:type II secretory pathway component PulF
MNGQAAPSRVPTLTPFLFVAMKPGGGRTFGVRQATHAPALAQSLRAEGRLLMQSWKLPAWAASPEKGLSTKDQVALNEQLAQLLTRGVPLVEALDVAAQTVRTSAKPRIMRMRDLVAAGSSFADACRTVGGFDNVTIAVYRGAERTGDLAGAAKELGISARRRMKVAGKAATLMLYPAIVLSISLMVAGVMLVFVVPRMAEGLTQSGVALPWFSKIVMGLGVWMQQNLLWIGIAAGTALVTGIVLRRAVLKGASILLRRLPAIGDVVLAQESARFFSVMGAMSKTGVPLADALSVANQAIGHPTLRKQLDRLRDRLIAGGILRTLIDEVTAFPVATRRLLMAAERSGDLENAFHTLATDMTDEVDTKSARLLAVLEPALIVLMFLIIGSVVMALMLPMLTITSRLGS